jgi:hypothetical protein
MNTYRIFRRLTRQVPVILRESLVAFFFGLTLILQGQTAPPTPKASPDVVAGIPVNYDEAKVGSYSLPDALKLNNGKSVRDARTWYSKRRPEIVEMFETQQYGRAPGRPPDESFEIVDKGTPALNGKSDSQTGHHLSQPGKDRPGDRSAHLSTSRGQQARADVF